MKEGFEMEKDNAVDNFFFFFLTLKSKEECYRFFSDACTPKEIHAIAQRFNVGKMLYEKRLYSEIIKATGASTATISRVSRAINEGFQTAFERLKK